MASTTEHISLSGASAVGAGSAVDLSTARRNVSAIIVCAAPVTDGVVLVEASHDATDWVSVSQHRTRDSRNQFFNLGEGAYRYFRANIVRAIAGGGSITVTFMESD